MNTDKMMLLPGCLKPAQPNFSWYFILFLLILNRISNEFVKSAINQEANMKTKILLLLFCFFLTPAISIRANFINGTYTAVVTTVSGQFPFPVSVGDTFTDQFSYDADLFLLPADAAGNRAVPATMGAYFGAWITGGTRMLGELDMFVIGPDGAPVAAHCVPDSFRYSAELAGTTLEIDQNGSCLISATVTSFNVPNFSVPDAGATIGLMGVALSALALFRSYARMAASKTDAPTENNKNATPKITQ